MTLHHHLDDSTLVAHAAGTLSTEMALVVDCHLEYCAICRENLVVAEQLGGEMMMGLADTAVAMSAPSEDAKQALLASLDDGDIELPAEVVDEDIDGSELPRALVTLLGGGLEQLKWRSLAPGLKQARIAGGGDGLRVLSIAPGTCMPLHGHRGSELTLVLQGSYSDEIGRFQPGDIADLDVDTEHQPIVDRDVECICLVATDAPLKFRGIIPRLLQPFFGI